MIVYFAGVESAMHCEMFAGRYVLESFAAHTGKLMDRYRPTFAGMALDCGAFAALNSGDRIDIGEYAEFVARHGAAYAWCASLDAIDGGVEANLANWRELTGRGLDVMPTFHQGEPWEALVGYCAEAKRIGLGFQRPIRNARPWLEECFARIPASVQVHGWAMTSYTDLPFASVDSSTWLWEYKALLGVSGQGADALRCLTPGELVEIIQKKYERLPRRKRWDGRKQTGLFAEDAA